MAVGTREDTRVHLRESSEEDTSPLRIVGLSVPFPGAKRPLEEGEKLHMWKFVLMSGPRIAIPTADVYILGAWHPAYQDLLGLSTESKVGVLWTSSGGEMDFEPIEQEYLMRLLNDPRVSFVWFGDPALAQVYPEKGFYAPYPLDVDSIKVDPHMEKKDIATLFCPTGPKKNILNQLLAMKLVQRERKLTLHTNVQGYDVILKSLDCVRHEWLPEVEYHELLTSAKVNLACSWCETFNYNVAEAALMGTVSVTSPTIPLMGMRVVEVNNPAHIAEKILEGCGAEYSDTLRTIREDLKIRNYECKRILGERLSAL